jgi:fructoselysine 6-kinase
MRKVLAIGDNCIDDYTNLGTCFPGGGCVNFAVHARRAEAQAAYAGVIGDDQHGDWIRSALESEQVDTRQLRRLSGKTAVAFVELRDTERTFLGSNRGVREQLVMDTALREFIREFDHIHTTLDGCVDAYLADWHRAGQTTSYDFSHRARSEQLDLLPYVSIAFVSGQHMTKAEAAQRAVDLQKRNQGVVVVTLGALGSLACADGDSVRQPALPVKVVDTLGAGDAFQAAFVVEYLNTHNIQAALIAGASRAATVCQHLGGFGYPH